MRKCCPGVVVQRQVPGMVQTVQKTVEIPLLELLLDKVVDMPVGVQRQLLVSTCRKLRISPQFQLILFGPKPIRTISGVFGIN